jgi:hypothetical protein
VVTRHVALDCCCDAFRGTVHGGLLCTIRYVFYSHVVWKSSDGPMADTFVPCVSDTPASQPITMSKISTCALGGVFSVSNIHKRTCRRARFSTEKRNKWVNSRQMKATSSLVRGLPRVISSIRTGFRENSVRIPMLIQCDGHVWNVWANRPV